MFVRWLLSISLLHLHHHWLILTEQQKGRWAESAYILNMAQSWCCPRCCRVEVTYTSRAAWWPWLQFGSKTSAGCELELGIIPRVFWRGPEQLSQQHWTGHHECYYDKRYNFHFLYIPLGGLPWCWLWPHRQVVGGHHQRGGFLTSILDWSEILGQTCGGSELYEEGTTCNKSPACMRLEEYVEALAHISGAVDRNYEKATSSMAEERAFWERPMSTFFR